MNGQGIYPFCARLAFHGSMLVKWDEYIGYHSLILATSHSIFGHHVSNQLNMKTLITLLFSGLITIAYAQEQHTTLRVSLDEASCNEGAQYQVNLEECTPDDRQEQPMGLQESQRDWSNFKGVDRSFDCGETLSQEGCEAVFQLDGHALDKVMNISIVKFENGAMEMMQVVVPVQQASDQTEIVISNVPFKVTSVNLTGKLEKQKRRVVQEKQLVLVPAEGTF
jgi:hypothetical protein